MSKQIDWKATLNKIVYQHEFDEVVFNVKDIEDLANIINGYEDTINELKAKLETEELISNDRLAKLIDCREQNKDYHSLSKFKVYV